MVLAHIRDIAVDRIRRRVHRALSGSHNLRHEVFLSPQARRTHMPRRVYPGDWKPAGLDDLAADAGVGYVFGAGLDYPRLSVLPFSPRLSRGGFWRLPRCGW